MNPIKIVIWDLDETFWKGTLSEGGVEAIAGNLAAVKQLTRRGIINAIASKNDYASARAKLEQFAIWEMFVFPEIRWEPKGPSVRRILESCRLRSANALFLDDNRANRKEVEYYNPGIELQSPDFLPQLLSHPALQGKPDPSQKRWRQYKLLEKRQRESRSFGDNTDFLRQSQITVEIVHNLPPHKERILELIQRTNQLNFTKERTDCQSLERLLDEPDQENAVIVVRDRYGDYGVSGFYSLDRRRHCLRHFLFSCRILHLGVEQWLYAQLRYPDLEVRGEVAAGLDDSPAPDWIREFQAAEKTALAAPLKSLRVLLKGGCDLEQMAHYLVFDGLDVDRELTYVGSSGEPIHHEDTTLLRLGAEADPARLDQVIEGLPFCDCYMFQTRVFDDGYDAVVYSVLMDYTRHLYRHRATGIAVPYGDGNLFTSRPATGATAGSQWLTPEFMAWFGQRFEHIGPIQPEQFRANLEYLRQRIAAPLVVINAAEVAHDSDRHSEGLRRHCLLNEVLGEFVENTESCYLLDVRRIVTSRRLLCDSIRHYKRSAYPRLAGQLVDILSRIRPTQLQRRRWELAKSGAIHRLQHLKRSWQTRV